MKKLFLRISQYSQENTSEYCKIFKNNYFEVHLGTVAFVILEIITLAEKEFSRFFEVT